MILLRILLYPFSVLYDFVTRVRNFSYSAGLKKSHSFQVPVIAVGNLSVGGTGKTPMIEYLIRLLKTDFQIATLSRGYGRNTRGVRIAGVSDTAKTLGDEPFQFYKKFKHEVVVAVGEKRALAMPAILNETATNLILLDDAFQHRAVSPCLSILLTSYSNPFYQDLVLPAGRLREARLGAARADVIVVTKCDESIDEEEMITVTKQVQNYAGSKPVFFTSIHHGQPTPIQGATRCSHSVILVSGIAQAAPLEEYVSSTFKLLRHFKFADHHRYNADDIQKIISSAKASGTEVSILTTEKDMVKLSHPEFASVWAGVPWFYLPIETRFVKNGAEFDKLIFKAAHGKAKS